MTDAPLVHPLDILEVPGFGIAMLTSMLLATAEEGPERDKLQQELIPLKDLDAVELRYLGA